MDEGFPQFTYRVLGYLLLGVVRIFSQKVEYVLLDCNQMLLKAKQAATAKRNEAQIYSFLAPHHSITLPESLELDKFNFDDMGVEKRDHMLPKEEIILKDLWTNVEASNFPPNGICGDGVAIELEMFLDSGTPHQDILSPHQVDMYLHDTLMHDMDNTERGIETLIPQFASPVEACEAEMVNLPAHLLSYPAVSDANNDENEACRTKQADSSGGPKNQAKELFLSVERSPERNLSYPSDGAGTRQFKAIPTPVNKESVPVKRKRKCLIDEQVVLSNKMVKESIDYSGDLVRKRGRVPQTVLDIWKLRLMLDLKNNLARPLIHCALFDSKKCHHDYKFMSAEIPPNFGASKILEVLVSCDDKVTYSDIEKIDGPDVSNVEKVGEHIAIAPETPHKDARVEGFPLTENFERVRATTSSNSTEDLTIEKHEELLTEFYKSLEFDFQEPDGWSSSTRQALQDLRSALSGKTEHQEKAAVNLHEALEGKSKGTSAKMFYDILVLKCRGMVNVQQDKPYGDILVTKSTGWEAHDLENYEVM